MKKMNVIFVLCFLAFLSFTKAQAPQAFKYQAVARDLQGTPLNAKAIMVKASILKGSETGIAIYTETSSVITNKFGLFSLNIGDVNPANFATIDWGSDKHFLSIELSQNAGTTYVLMGTIQLLSVPYALNASSLMLSAADGSKWNVVIDNNGKLSSKRLLSPITMVLVEGGTFKMGNPSSTYSDEYPQHLVTLTNSFWIGVYELTQKQYKEVMGVNPSTFKNDNNPVDSVTWWDGVKYCNKRSMLEGLPVCYSYNGDTLPDNWTDSPMDDSKIVCNWTVKGYRLLTEAEWEFAAKGGVKNKWYNDYKYLLYSGSDNPLEVAWYNSDPDHYPKMATTTVGTLKANELGLYDMSGNVMEWTGDWFDNFTNESVTNPQGPKSGPARVFKNGSYIQTTTEIRSTFRMAYISKSKIPSLGFRICKTN